MEQPRNDKGQFESRPEEPEAKGGSVRAQNVIQKTEHVSTTAEHAAARKAAAHMSRREEPRPARGESE